MIKLLHCVLSCTTVDAGRNRNQVVRGKTKRRKCKSKAGWCTERENSSRLQWTFIPSCFIFRNCCSKGSNNWQWLLFSDLFLLHISLFLLLSLLPQHFYLSRHYPFKPVVFQHLFSRTYKINFILLTWTFKSAHECQESGWFLQAAFAFSINDFSANFTWGSVRNWWCINIRYTHIQHMHKHAHAATHVETQDEGGAA